MSAPHVLLAAGGTGGHVFPAEALASELMDRGYRLGLVTDKRGKAYGGALGELETHRILAGGIAGKNVFKRIKSVAELGIGTWQAWRLLHRLQPDAVVGFGGYASVPTMMAATSPPSPPPFTNKTHCWAAPTGCWPDGSTRLPLRLPIPVVSGTEHKTRRA